MAGYEEGEDFFDDDDFDALPPNALAELESNAIQFTQALTQAQLNHPSSDYGDEFEAEDLDDAVVIDESRSTPANISSLHRIPSRALPKQEQFRQQHYGTVSHPNPNLTNRQQQNYNIPPPPRFIQPSRSPVQVPVFTPQNDQEVLNPETQSIDQEVADKLRRYDEILKERDALKEELTAKSGEIYIVRSKQEKAVKEYEREINALRKLNDDKLAKQQKALDAARIAEKNATTERDFIKQDLAEESERVRRLAKAREAEPRNNAALTTTPKKKKALPHRDGFDDDEITLSPSKFSPSKFQRRNGASPAKPGKRKRKAAESPAGALQVIQPEEPLAVQPDGNAMVVDDNIMAKLAIDDDRFSFLGAMLDHQIDSDHLRTIEELGKYALPSSPGESFQATILGKMPTLGLGKFPRDLPIDFCELLISLWSTCIEKEFLAPVYLLIDMLTFALQMKTSSVAPHIIDSLLPVAQLTADLVAIPRFSKNPTPHDKHIDVSACMSIIYLAALGCMSSQEHITRFWKLMRWDFVLMMLSTNQAKADYETMLHLLSTSVMRDTIGTIPGDHTPNSQTGYILDRLTYPLNEVPLLPMSTEKYDLATISNLRIQILQLMTSMTRSPYASKAIATHNHAIGRLVCLMSDELDVLYDFKSGHEESARIINLSARLLYHLITKYDDIIEIQKKLSVILGGTQKYLLCLSRLNFSEEDLVLESGIDPDVPAYALELLELIVTPEEGDAIQMAFSSS